MSDQSRMQVEFIGCIFPLTSDNSEKPAMLTDEQTDVFASIIYQSFKQWYAQ